MKTTYRNQWLLSGVALAALIAIPANASAQDPAAGPAVTEVEEIVVTGTLIRGIAPTGTNVVGVSQEEIVTTGAASANDLLARVPQISNAFNTAPSPGATIALPINRPNIRNLGASGGSTTLVLLNGRRMVGAGVLQTSPDPSVIPPGVLERVEVIPDGGSSIYGSDAIGGVINFITRKRFDGVELTARYGVADSYSQYDANLTAGRDWGSGSALISLVHAEHDNIFARDRDYISANHTARGGSDFRVQNCEPGNITVDDVTYGLPSRTPGANLCDENQFIDFYPQEERQSVFASVVQDISPALTFELSGYYSERETLSWGQGSSDGTGLRGSGTITDANPYFQPIGAETSQQVNFNYSSAFGDAERNPSEFTSLGIAPELIWRAGGDWQVRAGLNYGRSTNEVSTYQINTVAEAAALAGTTVGTALNPYDVDATDPGVLAAIRDFEIRGWSEQTIRSARVVADGPLFAMPAGDLRVAVGAEYYEEELDAAQGDGPRGAPNLFRATSERDVSSVFGEAVIPLMGPDASLGSFDLSASVRHDSYSDVGETTNPKIGFTWRPTSDVTVRGNWGTSFHAPSLADTGNAVDTRAQVLGVSPFRPADSPFTDLFRPTILLAGGNADLKPEEAETWSIGTDWRPSGALDGLAVSLTYFNVEFTDAIGLAPFFNGASFFANPAYTSYWTINPTQAEAEALTAGQRVENAPSIASLYAGGPTPFAIIDARRNNLGTLKVNGIDFDVSYAWPMTFGEIQAGLAGSYTLERESQSFPGAAVVDELENGTGQLNLVANLGLSADALRMNLSVNHNDGYPVLGVAGQNSVGSFTTANVFVGYDLSGPGLMNDLTLTLNVDNIFDQDPPWSNSVQGYANGSTLGRLISVGVRKRF
ncbi:MAG: iron complex outermembrane receptor protein [Brevundimonas sp.]|jgi:iron complex outermembrane receptor protein|uniref:TonB-dependent receptor domain-containing protein n=1 Tax=Brevundimonas sp. TaxID=1871086 RepID=UPI0039E57BAF